MENKILGYNPHTGEPIYAKQNNNIEYAKFSDRLLAYLLDWLIIVASFSIIIAVITPLIATVSVEGDNTTFPMLIAVISAIMTYGGQPIICFLMEASKKQASIGKRVRKTIVVNSNFQKLTYGESFVRMILKVITTFIPILAIISIVTICASEKHQALHDMMLNQFVIKNNNN